MKELLVIKIGGSYWGQSGGPAESRCRQLGRDLKALCGRYDVVVVPSAFAGRTDQLKAAAEIVYGKPLQKRPEVEAILGKGELEASHAVYEVLRSAGQKARAVYPDNPDFPIRTDSHGVVDLGDSYRRLAFLRDDVRAAGEVLIVPGFVAKNCAGIMTLGRNGSDYSAVLVGEGVGAGRIVKLGAAPGIPDGNGGWLDEVRAPDLLERVGPNGEGYEKVDCIFHPDGLRILSEGRTIHVTNTLDSYLSGPVCVGTVIRG